MNDNSEGAINSEVTIDDFIEYWRNYSISDENIDEDNDYKILIVPPEEELVGHDEVVVISDDVSKSNFKNKVMNALMETEEFENYNAEDLETLLNNYLKCLGR